MNIQCLRLCPTVWISEASGACVHTRYELGSPHTGLLDRRSYLYLGWPWMLFTTVFLDSLRSQDHTNHQVVTRSLEQKEDGAPARFASAASLYFFAPFDQGFDCTTVTQLFSYCPRHLVERHVYSKHFGYDTVTAKPLITQPSTSTRS